MLYIPKAKRNTCYFCISRCVHDLLIKVLAKFLLGAFLCKCNAVPKQIGNFLIYRHSEKSACQLVIGSPHISVSAALHIVDDFFIAVNCRIQPIIVQFRINRRFISVTAAMLIDSLADKVNSFFFVFSDGYKIVICFDCSSPLHKNRRVIAFYLFR